MNSHIEQIIVIITSIGTFSFALAYTIKRLQNLLYTMRGLKTWEKFVLTIKTCIKCTEWLKEHLANKKKLIKVNKNDDILPQIKIKKYEDEKEH